MPTGRDDSDAAEARRRARSHWPIARHDLGDEPSEDLSALTTPAQRIAMMKELAETAWRLAGRSLPTYARHEMPGRIFRPGEPVPEDE